MISRFAVFAALALFPRATRPQAVPLPGNSPPAQSSSTGLKTARAVRRVGAIRLDGRLDESAWQLAPRISDFTQSYPAPGRAPVDSTVARVLYDDDALYVGVRMYDSRPDSIAAQLSRRDASGIYSDWLHVLIDSYFDRRTAFHFSVNPLGVKRDVFHSNDGDEDPNWDAVWEVATRVDSAGWVAEFRIPLSQLRFEWTPAGGDRLWGFQIQRDIARRNERDSWSPWSPETPGFVSRFGALNGVSGIPSRRPLELLPYASSKLTRAPGTVANPFYRATATKPSAGLDLKYGLRAALTMTATVHPDFGQVEVDPSVVNLTAFETFFTEKRPFFLEGADVLSFGQMQIDNDVATPRYFYSRRIGRPPQRFAGGPGITFVDRPDQTDIAVATKITGEAGPWTIGFLDAVTPEMYADVMRSTGQRSTTGVEPLTSYLVSRVKRDFRGGQTFIGSILTSALRDVSDTALGTLLRSRATFGGVDFEHDMAQRAWIVTGFLGASDVAGSPSTIAATQTSSTHYFQRPRRDVPPFRSEPSFAERPHRRDRAQKEWAVVRVARLQGNQSGARAQRHRIPGAVGLPRPAGTVRVFGSPVRAPDDAVDIRRHIGFVTEDKEMYPYMTVEQIIRFTRSFFPMWRADREQRYLQMFDLSLRQRIPSLSKGMRSKLMLLLALSHETDLLVLDEPSDGLDAIAVDDMLREIVSLAAQDGTSVFYSSHQLEQVEQISDHVAMVDHGRCVVQGAVDDLKEHHKRLHIVLDDDVREPIQWLAGALSVRREGRTVSILAADNVSALVEQARSLASSRVELFPVTLKEIFLDYARAG